MTLDDYNQKWLSDSDTKPLCIFIGGAAGTGKSTLTSLLQPSFAPGTVISTGTVRAVLRTVISKQENPYLYEQTFTVHNVPGTTDILDGYKQQCKPILASVDKLVDFANIERQHHFIEGSHLYPRGNTGKHSSVKVIEIFLYVPDEQKHMEMLKGETHRRNISDREFEVCRQIQDFVITEANRLKKPVLESTAPNLKERALGVIKSALS